MEMDLAVSHAFFKPLLQLPGFDQNCGQWIDYTKWKLSRLHCQYILSRCFQKVGFFLFVFFFPTDWSLCRDEQKFKTEWEIGEFIWQESMTLIGDFKEKHTIWTSHVEYRLSARVRFNNKTNVRRESTALHAYVYSEHTVLRATVQWMPEM